MIRLEKLIKSIEALSKNKKYAEVASMNVKSAKDIPTKVVSLQQW